jgi:hypothetical protein
MDSRVEPGYGGIWSEWRHLKPCYFCRNPAKVRDTFRVRIKLLDAFDQTHYKFRHHGILRPALDSEQPGFVFGGFDKIHPPLEGGSKRGTRFGAG